MTKFMLFRRLSPVLAVLAVYLALVFKNLHTRHPKARPRPPPSLQEYASADSYKNIDMLRAIPPSPTHIGYAIIGGSGFLGLHLVRLLLLRGETNIRILDLTPPPNDILAEPAVSFVRTDVTSLPSVRAGLSEKFLKTGEAPRVVFHMAAIIRFWERASYTWPLSHRVNVQGTANVITAVQELPSVRILIYTSTGDTARRRPHHFRVGQSIPGNLTASDNDDPLPVNEMSGGCYARSKRMAENLIKAANGVGNLRTGILRPGSTIVGVNDRLITSTLTFPRVPVFARPFTLMPVNAWDVAAAHLLYEMALEQKPDTTAGSAFLITGPELWTMGDIYNAIEHYSSRPIIFQEIPPLAVFFVAHLMEMFLYIRWHIVSFLGWRPSLDPTWLGEAVYLQPVTLEFLSDAVVDDSRARELLDYRPQWNILQTIKCVRDKFESGEAGSKHGLQLKSVPVFDN